MDRRSISFRPRQALALLSAICVSLGALLPASSANAGVPTVENPALLRQLPASMRTLIARSGFAVAPPGRISGTQGPTNPMDPLSVYWQFYDLYDENRNVGLPSFITTDALLHTFSTIYDSTLTALERTTFVPKLDQLSSGLMSTAAYQYGATTNAQVKEAARLNLGYLAVAGRLLDPKTAIPALVAGPVNGELALIAAHRGFARSPLLGYEVDYSQFIPRGHYAGDEMLSRYFRAMIWYGRLTFTLNGPDAALHTRQALLLVRGLTLVPDLYRLWAAVFDPITTWVGRSDNLTVRDYQKVMAQVYPAKAPVSALNDNARLARFMTLAVALPGPQINGVLSGSSKGATQQDKGMRLFGQRFVADAGIMEALIYEHVGTRQQPRIWPMGLDVAATLGSKRATALLSGPLQQTRYAHYAQALAAQQKTYSSLPASTWNENLYWGWLNVLRAVWGDTPPAVPSFMKTTAWADKSLATGLGSWTELRHNTILYVKQPYGLGAGGPPPSPRVYVEPAPLVYARLLSLTQQLKSTLIGAGILDALPEKAYTFPAQYFQPALPRGDKGYRAALDAYAEIVALVQKVAEQELLGQTVTTADLQTLGDIGGLLGVVSVFFQDNANGRSLTSFDKQVAEVTDVFTEPGSGQVLEEGVGDVLPIFAVVTVNGHRWLARGGVYSYYEFQHAMSDRLTDQAWRTLTARPMLPAWTASYIAH